MHVVNLSEKFSQFSDYYNPKVAADVNGFQIKLVKIKGTFVWHHHDSEDELFMVVHGELHMKLRDADGRESDKTIRAGEFIVVPHGVEHMPYALEETHILLFEPATTLNTGNLRDQHTVTTLERI